MRSPLIPAFATTLVLASCSTLQPTAETMDGVYQRPSGTSAAAAIPPTEDSDYYDPEQAAAAGTERGYYDVTYNDPYYYNMDRFSFGLGVSGWNGNTGMGMSMGYNSPYYGGYYDPFCGPGMGNPYWSIGMGMGWGNPYWGMGMGWGSPYCGMGWNPYMGMGWGGPYYGPWGSCYGCYSPVVIVDGNHVVGHRPSISGGGGSGGGGGVPGQPTYTTRSPVNLLHNDQQRTRPTDRPSTGGLVIPQRGSGGGSKGRTNEARPATGSPAARPGTGGSRSNGMSPSPAPSRSGGGGAPSMPSRPR